MVCDRSNIGVNVIEPGKLARSSGNSALTELATSTAFAPACRITASTTTEPGGLKTAHPEKARDALVLHALAHISDVAQVNRRPVWVARHDQLAITLRLVDLPIGLQHKGAMRAVELSRARIDRARFNPAGQIVHRQAARSQCRRVGLDPNRALHAIDAHLRNARQDVDALRNSGGRVLIQIPVRQRIRHQA